MMHDDILGAESVMKHIAKAFGAFLMACALALGVVCLSPGDARAYTYDVTLYAGNGTIDGKQSIVLFDGVKYNEGERIIQLEERDGVAYINGHAVIPEDDRYYVKGIRQAGKDDGAVDLQRIENVEGDMQYVVSYGLKKDQTRYRIDYLDTNGNELRESKYITANVGDKPVAAYEYIEGYIPNAYNITGTLQKDELKNVFKFIYTSVSALGDEVVTIPGSNKNGIAVGPSIAMRAQADEESAEGGEDGAQAGAERGEEATGPVELYDIDDEETPLASSMGPEPSFDSSSDAVAQDEGNSMILPAVIVSLICAAGIIAFLIVMFMRRKGTSRK